jgi:hypothetical protein
MKKTIPKGKYSRRNAKVPKDIFPVIKYSMDKRKKPCTCDAFFSSTV